ncbi:hypothetical protein QM480_05025 [Flectobacillus sp. DC10W]|uniref:Calx-beta domain-containing protein n=1 Tax=Flectobacillus longus TaxID=2984207 RepID=A0ABT6YJA0_9BACT|nr:hypothetical protein [Flectobacillus longus]MDI9863674.1 hypothetical protein [Flectobacillus longus]
MKAFSVFLFVLFILTGCSQNEDQVITSQPSKIRFLSTAKVTYEESKSDTFSIKLVLDKPSKKDEVVELVFKGTASLGQDFQLITPSPLTIKAGETSTLIKFKINKDANAENALENCIITLKPLNGTLVVDNNSSIEFEIAEAPAKSIIGFEFKTLDIEESSEVKVRLKIDKPLTEDVTILLENQTENQYYRQNANSMYCVMPAGKTEATVSLNLMDYRPTKGRNLFYNLKIKSIDNDKIDIDIEKQAIAIRAIDANQGLHLTIEWEGIADIDYYEIIDKQGSRFDWEYTQKGSVSVQNLQEDGLYYLKFKASKPLNKKIPITIIAQNNTTVPTSTVGKYKFDFKDTNDSLALKIYKQGLNYTIIPRDVVIVPPVGIG